jgi:methylthioribose-1-phosphate isomerase
MTGSGPSGSERARTVDWSGDEVVALDQTRLPHEVVMLRLHDVEALAEAIRSLRIRGAMALGVAGGLGIALAIRRAQEHGADAVDAAHRAAAVLAGTRPTAVNLVRGVEHVLAALGGGAEAAVEAATALIGADVAANGAIARTGAELVDAELLGAHRAPLVALTHCNAGALAGVEVGTALGIVAELHRRGRLGEAIACETRPLLQGARLTCFELARMQVPCRLVVDSAAAGLIATGVVDLVVVGADRIAANGDVANKVGTLGHALACRHAGIPFVVAAPEATIDAGCPSGAEIPIEERPEEEVLEFDGVRTAPPGVRARNPAFDVTPAELVAAIVTERRVIRPAAGERPGTYGRRAQHRPRPSRE